METISIALAEDNAINKSSFLQKIALINGYKVVFAAENGVQCLEKLNSISAGLLPRVVFVDLEMPEMNGIELIAHGKQLYPEVEFIVLTIFDDDSKIFDAIRAGASGYLLKHVTAPELEDALSNVLQYGGAPMSPSIARKTLAMLAHGPETEQEGSLPHSVTTREKELLRYMVKGWDAKRIADKLFISIMTVRKHIANIYKKLHVSSQAQVISVAHQQKWFARE